MTEPKEGISFVVDEPPLLPVVVEEGAVERRRKRVTLLVAVAGSILLGLGLGLTGLRVFEVIWGLLIAVSGAVWCHHDADERGYTLRLWLRLLVLLQPIVGFPIYGFLTRGWGGFKFLGFVLLFFLLFIFCFGIPAELSSFIRGVALPD